MKTEGQFNLDFNKASSTRTPKSYFDYTQTEREVLIKSIREKNRRGLTLEEQEFLGVSESFLSEGDNPYKKHS